MPTTRCQPFGPDDLLATIAGHLQGQARVLVNIGGGDVAGEKTRHQGHTAPTAFRGSAHRALLPG